MQTVAAVPSARSGLLVPIPEAEAVIGALRLRHDPVAALGIPAHVTVLFPFVPAAAVDDDLDDALRTVFGRCTAFGYGFGRVGRFGDTTVFLEPEPADAFATLTRQVEAQWPHYPPYEGAFDVVIPHLTVGDQLASGAADPLEAAANEALASHGRISGRCSEVVLMTEGPDGQWTTAGRYPLSA
jgi:2'-5' RNA ligase